MRSTKRALWLLNHTTLREFEVPILRSLGYEVYLPKLFPYDEGNLSASIDESYDETLTIEPSELELLNRHNFYTAISSAVRDIINRNFDVAFFGFFPKQLSALVRNFSGALVMRPFGLANEVTYTNVTSASLGYFFFNELQNIQDRFWFGQAYDHLSEIESGIFRRKSVTLPLGIKDATAKSEWDGTDAKILFVCPRIGSSPYFNHIYRDFKNSFAGLPYVLGGAQPIRISDPNITGFLPRAEYDRMMRNTRVMYYHSREKRHLHYHPIEAVRAGMPLVFMSGGLLDEIGGVDLPGRCLTTKEARNKLERILAGDSRLIQSIRNSQHKLLQTFSREYCEPIWRKNFLQVEQALHEARHADPIMHRFSGRRRVAVILPQAYRGGTLDMVKLLAKMLKYGSELAGRNLEVVFAHPDSSLYVPQDFVDLHQLGIATRSFHWRILTRAQLTDVQKIAGYSALPPRGDKFSVPSDDTNNLLDCDFWFVASDRLDEPLAPLRPYCMFAHDYLQRYFPQLLGGYYENGFVQTARNSIAVLANTPHTIEDIVQYVGVERSKTVLVPHLTELQKAGGLEPGAKGHHFIWTTNAGPHKNHILTLRALTQYYEASGGSLDCHITGVESSLFNPKNKGANEAAEPHVEAARNYIRERPQLAKRLVFHGDLPYRQYLQVLSGARFLLHNVIMDNGTLCAVEAAYNGTPTLSSDYPPMRYLSERYGLNALFFDPADEADLAEKLAWMEENWCRQQALLPEAERLEKFGWKSLAPEFWEKISTIIG